MTKEEAIAYRKKRWEELGDLKVVSKVNIIIQELRQQGFVVTLHDNNPYPIKGVSLDNEEVIYHV